MANSITSIGILQDRRRLLRLRAGQRRGAQYQAARRLQRQRAQCRKIIDRIGHKSFRIWYDPGNVFYYSDGKLDPVDDAAAVDGRVIGMSVKDFRPPTNVDLTPGAGKVDFAKVLARLKQGGFTCGPLVVECLAPGDLAHLKTEALKARRFLKDLTGQKG